MLVKSQQLSDVVHMSFCQEDEDQTGRLSVSFAVMLGSEGKKKLIVLIAFWIVLIGIMPMR